MREFAGGQLMAAWKSLLRKGAVKKLKIGSFRQEACARSWRNSISWSNVSQKRTHSTAEPLVLRRKAWGRIILMWPRP